jgi:hypothetical protein
MLLPLLLSSPEFSFLLPGGRAFLLLRLLHLLVRCLRLLFVRLRLLIRPGLLRFWLLRFLFLRLVPLLFGSAAALLATLFCLSRR